MGLSMGVQTGLLSNITNYSDSELSLLVFKTESLYDLRFDIELLVDYLEDLYIFNMAQYETLLNDLEIDAKGS